MFFSSLTFLLSLSLSDSIVQWMGFFGCVSYEVFGDFMSIAELEHCILRNGTHTILHSTVQCSAVQYSISQYSTVYHSTPLCNTQDRDTMSCPGGPQHRRMHSYSPITHTDFIPLLLRNDATTCSQTLPPLTPITLSLPVPCHRYVSS